SLLTLVAAGGDSALGPLHTSVRWHVTSRPTRRRHLVGLASICFSILCHFSAGGLGLTWREGVTRPFCCIKPISYPKRAQNPPRNSGAAGRGRHLPGSHEVPFSAVMPGYQ